MPNKNDPPVPEGWKPMSEYNGDDRVIVGTWVQARFEGELMWRWDVSTYEGLYGEDDLDWDFEEYLGFIPLPDRVEITHKKEQADAETPTE